MSEKEMRLREDRTMAVVFMLLFAGLSVWGGIRGKGFQDRMISAQEELCAIHFERSDTLQVLRARPYCKLEGVR